MILFTYLKFKRIGFEHFRVSVDGYGDQRWRLITAKTALPCQKCQQQVPPGDTCYKPEKLNYYNREHRICRACMEANDHAPD